MFLKERKGEKSKIIHILVYLPKAALAAAGQGGSQEPRISLGSPMRVQKTKHFGHPLLLSQVL